MKIEEKIAKSSNYSATNRAVSAVRYLVIHYTGNNGDTAKNNAEYFSRESIGASAHYFVDPQSIWRSVPDKHTAWHCGAKSYKHAACRNANSIGIEICILDKQGKIRQESIDHAATLTRELMKKYGVPVSNVLRHYDVTGKNCPAPMVSNPKLWESFRAKLTQKEEEIVTQEQFNAMYQNINPLYTSLGQVPDYWREETQTLMDIGAIRGDGKTKLSIRQEELKSAIIARRCVMDTEK